MSLNTGNSVGNIIARNNQNTINSIDFRNLWSKVDNACIIKLGGSHLEKYLFSSELNEATEDY
jgi:hypothetical protein